MSDRPQTGYKVMSGKDLAALERDGRHAGAGDDLTDGYIHLSTAEQLTGTVDKHCRDIVDPQVVAIDLASLGGALRWEDARGGQLFPHLYGPLLLECVVAYGPLERDADGDVRLPVAG